MLDGKTVQQKVVQDFFHSVQLNVNNPHFLIMQGRITKVLNMKPPEILSMIEEAAGTRMFETKKEAALKTIEKKQEKVAEFTRVMELEINPTLVNLRGDREKYQTYLSHTHELERLLHFCAAYDYSSLMNEISSAENEKQRLRISLTELETLEKTSAKEAKECETRVKELRAELERELEGKLGGLKAEEDNLGKELVKADTMLKNQKELLSSEKSLLSTMEKQLDGLQRIHKEKTAELTIVDTDCTVRGKEYLDAEKEVLNKREQYQNACAGIVDESNAELLSIPEQIGAWEKRQRESESQLQQIAIRMDHSRKAVGEKRKQSLHEQEDYAKAMLELEDLNKKVSKAEEALASALHGMPDEEALSKRLHSAKQAVTGLRDRVSTLTAQVEARLSFEFRDPVKGFDRKKVLGLVARLVQVKDSRNSAALEVSAGGKLYQVVVDTEQTGKLLLDHGKLKKRVTILPLNKLNARCVDTTRVKAAEAIAKKMGGTASLAVELVGFEEEVRKAMEYVFGGAIICDSKEVAKAITFDRSVSTKTVTLEGDVYDPSGTLTGGSNSQLGTILSKLQELAATTEALRVADSEILEMETNIRVAKAASALSKKATEEVQKLTAARLVCEERIQDSRYVHTMAEVSALEASIMAFEKESSEHKESCRRAQQELEQLKGAHSSKSRKREAIMKELEDAAKIAQKALAVLKSSMTALKHRKDVLAAEVANTAKEIAVLNEQQAICTAGIARLTQEVVELFALVR